MPKADEETKAVEVEGKDVLFLFICRLNERFNLSTEEEMYLIGDHLEVDMEKFTR